MALRRYLSIALALLFFLYHPYQGFYLVSRLILNSVYYMKFIAFSYENDFHCTLVGFSYLENFSKKYLVENQHQNKFFRRLAR
jgi:hypothetical protein